MDSYGMNDFVFSNPTRIVFGKDKELRIGKEILQVDENIKKVMLLYGRSSIKKSGLYDRIVGSLNDSGISVLECPGVQSNPVISHARNCIDNARRDGGVDGIVAVGGGSVLDEGKCIAAGMMMEEGSDPWDLYCGKQVVKSALPLFTVLTLAATGSEMNGGSVMTNEEFQHKLGCGSPHLYPRVSILNPSLTCTVPKDYTAYGAVDAMSHVMESYFTRASGAKIQDRLSDSLCKSLIESCDVLMKEPGHLAARGELMWCATLCLNGLVSCGYSGASFPNHMIEHSLSAVYGIPHGAGMSIVITAWMKWVVKTGRTYKARFERFAQGVFGESTAEQGITRLEEWYRSVGTPVRLYDVGVDKADVHKIAENVMITVRRWGSTSLYSIEDIENILNFAFE